MTSLGLLAFLTFNIVISDITYRKESIKEERQSSVYIIFTGIGSVDTDSKMLTSLFKQIRGGTLHYLIVMHLDA